MDNLPEQQPDPQLELRVSYEDREAVAEQLRRAAGDGRLDIEELEERLERAFAAKTFRDLQPLLTDLPGARPPHPTGQPTGNLSTSPTAGLSTNVGGVPVLHRSQAIMGDHKRVGSWVVPRLYTATSIMATVLLDLREASFAEREVTISCTAVMGDVRIRVGPDVTVVNEVNTIMGDVKIHSSRDLPPAPQGGPVLRIRGTALMGDVKVERLAPGERRVRRSRRGHHWHS